MTTLVTDPARVREALAYYEMHGHRATLRDLGVHSHALSRWVRNRREHGPDWPTAEFESAWHATKAARDRHAAEEARRRNRRILNGGQPLMKDATGTHRRIRALMRLGWPTQHIADLGPWKTGAAVLVLTRNPTCTEANEAAIRRIYDQLSMKLGPSVVTRNRAIRAGWLPPLAWDDVDDPAEDPHARNEADREEQRWVDWWATRGFIDDASFDVVKVRRVLAGEVLDCTPVERRVVLERAHASGRSLNDIERQMGWKVERYFKLGEAA